MATQLQKITNPSLSYLLDRLAQEEEQNKQVVEDLKECLLVYAQNKNELDKQTVLEIDNLVDTILPQILQKYFSLSNSVKNSVVFQSQSPKEILKQSLQKSFSLMADRLNQLNSQGKKDFLVEAILIDKKSQGVDDAVKLEVAAKKNNQVESDHNNLKKDIQDIGSFWSAQERLDELNAAHGQKNFKILMFGGVIIAFLGIIYLVI